MKIRKTLFSVIVFCLTAFLAYGAGPYAKRYATGTALEVITPTTGDIRYLKLDCSNDPLTNTLDGDAATFTGLGTFDKLTLTNPTSTWDDIQVTNRSFTFQHLDTSDTSYFYYQAATGQPLIFALYSDGRGNELNNLGIKIPMEGTGDAYDMYMHGVFNLRTGAAEGLGPDIDDFIRFQTVTINVPEITTVGTTPPNLKITAGSGTIEFGDNNFTNVGEIDLDLIRADAANGTVVIELDNAAGADFIVGNNNALLVEGDTDLVGIGTDDPRAQLDVSNKTAGSGVPTIDITNATGNVQNDPRIRFSTGSNPVHKWSIGVDDSTSDDPFVLASTSEVGSSQVMTLERGGQVGIGVVDPDTELEIFHAGTQLKLSYDANSFVTFSLDASDDLTVKPAASGGVRFQPTTTDTTDFFQVLDQDGGTPIFNVDSVNERVGIGTATPGATLSLNSGTTFDMDLSTQDTAGAFGTTELLIKPSGASASYPVTKLTVDTGDDIQANRGSSLVMSIGGTPVGQFAAAGSDLFFDARLDPSNIFFRNDTNQTRLFIETGGNIGIGTVSPSSLLDVDGVASLTAGVTGATPTAQLKFSNYYDNAGDVSLSHIDLGYGKYGFGITANTLNYISDQYHKFYDDSDLSNPIMTMDGSSGNVGIGMATAAAAPLHIKTSTGWAILESTGATSDAAMRFETATGDYWQYVMEGNAAGGVVGAQGNFGFLVNAGAGENVAMVLTLGRDVGIGTTSPDTKLQVVGTSGFGDDAGNEVLIEDDGDVNFVGGAGLPFGQLYLDEGALTVGVAASSTYYEVNDAASPSLTVGNLHNVTFSDHYLDVGAYQGFYLVTWSMSLQTTNAFDELSGTIMVDGVADVSATNHVTMPAANKEVGLSGTTIVDLTANKQVSLAVANHTATRDIILSHATLSIVAVGGT